MFGSRNRARERARREDEERKASMLQHRKKYNIYDIYPGASLGELIRTLGVCETNNPGLNRSRLNIITKWEELEPVYQEHIRGWNDSKKDCTNVDDKMYELYGDSVVSFHLYSSQLWTYDKVKPFSVLLRDIGELYDERSSNSRWCFYYNLGSYSYNHSVVESHSIDHVFGRDVVLVLKEIKSEKDRFSKLIDDYREKKKDK